jgi:hypothetical protein
MIQIYLLKTNIFHITEAFIILTMCPCRDRKKKYKMMKFTTGNDVDFVKLSQVSFTVDLEHTS